MSPHEKARWTAQRCYNFASWLNRAVEMHAIQPHARLCADPEGRDGLLVEWSLFGRKVEIYFAWTGETTLVSRDGAPVETRTIADRRRVVEELRGAIWWLEQRREPCPPQK